MSVSIGVFAATAMFLAIGGDTEENMKNMLGQCDEQILNCDVDKSKPVSSLWPTPEVRSEKPMCAFSLPTPITQADIVAQDCIAWGRFYKPLYQPEWTPADQPTAYGWDGHWWKLQL